MTSNNMFLHDFTSIVESEEELLFQQNPAGDAVVKKHHGDEDKQKHGGDAGMKDFVEKHDLGIRQEISAVVGRGQTGRAG